MQRLDKSAGRSRLAASRAPRLPSMPVAAKQVLPQAEGRERTASRMHDTMLTLPASTGMSPSIMYNMAPPGSPALATTAAAAVNPMSGFMAKLRMAWKIFFPDQLPDVTPKEEGKQRLRMILVADRCGMSPAGMAQMKKIIVRALEEVVDVDSEKQIDVSINVEPTVGTIYCVAVPIRRVKPEARMALGDGSAEDVLAEALQVEGVSLDWDPRDWDSDPSDRFPYGC